LSQSSQLLKELTTGVASLEQIQEVQEDLQSELEQLNEIQEALVSIGVEDVDVDEDALWKELQGLSIQEEDQKDDSTQTPTATTTTAKASKEGGKGDKCQQEMMSSLPETTQHATPELPNKEVPSLS
jgi:hypothetical protein